MHDDTTHAEVAAKGGRARKAKLSPERRAEIASRAATARWSADLPHATHTGDLKIGDIAIPCAVLHDGRRVLTENGITNALLGSRSGASKRLKRASVQQGAPLPLFLAPRQLNPFISDEMMAGPLQPISCVIGERPVIGYDANILPMICDVWLKARQANKLQTQQLDKAMKAEILMRGLAHIGIIALVDEATGYQDMRARDALAKILEAFVTKELRKWVSTFPADYYRELFRLRGWTFPNLPRDQQRRPMLVGKITNDIVYARLAPGVRSTLHKLTPRDEKGRLKNKLFQHLTEDIGHPKLREHLTKVVTVMQLSNDWPTFMGNMNRLMPKHKDLPPLLKLLDEMESQ